MDIVDRLQRLYVQHGTNYVQEAAEEIKRLRIDVSSLIDENIELKTKVKQLKSQLAIWEE
jgi:regulator of replication initiation timing